ncbi:MAG: hypothetical protein ACTSPB_22955, partial [Candidatus Thorarchaeota archaeon]
MMVVVSLGWKVFHHVRVKFVGQVYYKEEAERFVLLMPSVSPQIVFKCVLDKSELFGEVDDVYEREVLLIDFKTRFLSDGAIEV